MEHQIKEQLIKSVDAIRKKVKKLQNEESEQTLQLKKILKPVTTPLNQLINKDINKTEANCNINQKYQNFEEKSNISSSSNEIFSDAEDDTEISPIKFVEKPFNIVMSKNESLDKNDISDIYGNLNIPFGIRKENEVFMIGNSKVILKTIKSPMDKEKKYVMNIDSLTYELTPGLRELLFRKRPDISIVTEEDKLAYKEILYNTNAHKRYFDTAGQIKGDRGAKYKEIIKPLFSIKRNETKNIKSGGNLPNIKKYNQNTDFVYWDDPNELIERLQLLIASKNAGNNNHENEIISIIEELKEAGIIKE